MSSCDCDVRTLETKDAEETEEGIWSKSFFEGLARHFIISRKKLQFLSLYNIGFYKKILQLPSWPT